MVAHQDPGSGRSSERVGCVLGVRYRSAGHLLMSYCTNLSRGGLFIPTPSPLAMGDPVTLEVQLPGEDDVRILEGVVRWVRESPSDDGPAGMGVSFEDAEQVLGERIDAIVAELQRLTIAIVGDERQAWQHVAALARSLVTCETVHHAVDSVFAPDLSGADLVIVDLDSSPNEAMDLLRALEAMDGGPPTLALVASDNVRLRQVAETVAQVIPMPMDSAELQARMLERLARVDARPAT